MIDTDAGACQDTQPWSPGQKRGIDYGVGTHNRSSSVGDVDFAWFGNEGNLLTEDPSHQRRVYGAECHDERTVDGHELTGFRR
jgi:hypothetical protein